MDTKDAGEECCPCHPFLEPLSRLFGAEAGLVLPRRRMLVAAELFDEEAGIVVPAPLGDFGDGHIGGRQQEARALDAVVVQIVDRRSVDDRAEAAAKVLG